MWKTLQSSLRTRPSEKSKRGSERQAGAEVYTAPGMQAHFRFMIACLCALIGNTNRNPLVQLKETKNKQDVLARDVVGARISSYWAHGRQGPAIKWVRTNNYKFDTFRSIHFDPSLSPRPSFRFSEGLVPRLAKKLKRRQRLDDLPNTQEVGRYFVDVFCCGF